MEPAGANLGRFPSKFLLMVIPGLIASGVAASVLYAIHISRAPSSAELSTDLTPQGDGLSAEERRGLTRQMLKARRENPQEPAQVRPTPTSRPATTGLAEDSAVDTKTVDTKTVDTKAPLDRTPAVAPLPAARPPVARVRPDATVIATPAAPMVPSSILAVPSGAAAPAPAATAQQSAPLQLDPVLQPPVMVNPPPGAEPEPQPRGFAANVFSSLSVLAGTAANATGNTVNWVIDLPGKAISAGGKLLGGDSTASNPPAASLPAATAPPPTTVLPPATAPPPKRNL